MSRFIAVFVMFFGFGVAHAQTSGDYLTNVCKRNVAAAVLKNYKKSDRASVSDYNAWDKKTGDYAKKYTGAFEVVIAIETQECYEGWEVQTKIEYLNGSKTPSCTIKKVTYKDRDCA